MKQLQAAILKTLAYADVFSYPLTLKEIRHWLIGEEKASTSEVAVSLSNLTPRTVRSYQGYYFLKTRSHLVRLRQSRHRFSLKKLQLAQRVGEWLKLFPTIKLVAITGALAMHNSDKHDDIDLMIITATNRLWLTRLLVVPLISLFFKRRKPLILNPKSIIHRDEICLNLWLDETALAIPQPQRNLYTAHEVAQIKPLWSRRTTYPQFLFANSWINQYLPNIKIPRPKFTFAKYLILNTLYSLLNLLAFQFQYLYMKSKITHERISLHSAFFHPRDTAKLVMRQYHRHLIRLGLQP